MIELQVEWRAKAQQPADADEETKDYLVNLEMGALSQRLRDLEEKLVRAREEKKQVPCANTRTHARTHTHTLSL